MALTLKDIRAQYGGDPMRARLVDNFLEGSQSKVLPLLNFVDSKDALSYEFAVEDNLGGVGERNLNSAYQVTGDSTSPKKEVLSLFGGAIQTDNVYIDTKGDVARLSRIDRRMRASGKYFDRQFILGDPQGNGKQMMGLFARSVRRGRILWAAANGAALTLDLFDQALDSVSGDNEQKTAFMDRWMRRKLSALARAAGGAQYQFDDRRQLTAYDGCKIVTLMEDHQRQPIFSYTETRGTSNATGSLYVTRLGGGLDEDGVQGIRGPTFMKLRAPVNMGEYVKDVIDNVMGICDFDQNAFIRLGGILQQ